MMAKFYSRVEKFAGLSIWDANKVVIETLAASGNLLGSVRINHRLPALLAPQDAGDIPRHAPVVHRHEPAGRCRQDAA